MNTTSLINYIPKGLIEWEAEKDIINILQLDIRILKDKVGRVRSFNIQPDPSKINFLDICALLESYLNPSIQKLQIININQAETTEFNNETDEQFDFKLHLIKGDLTYEPPENSLRLRSFEDTFSKPHPIKAYYKENLFIVNYSLTLDWKSIFKINAFKYRLMEEYYAHQNITLDSRLSIFYRALVNDDLSTANATLNKILEDPRIKTIKYEKFKKHFKPDTSKKLKQIENDILYIEQEQERLLREYTENLNNIDSLKDNYEVLLNKNVNDTSEEVIKYLTKNPYIDTIHYINSHQLAIFYQSPILYYDEQLAKKFMNKYKGTQQLLMQILYEKKYTIYTRCRIDFETNHFKITTQEIGNSGYLYRHPHIDQYHCLGNHPKEIRKWVQNQDYIGALDQITAATLNLNLTDSIVVGGFAMNVRDHPNIPSFKDNSTGKFITFNDIKK